jgi:hypothetical protein
MRTTLSKAALTVLVLAVAAAIAAQGALSLPRPLELVSGSPSLSSAAPHLHAIGGGSYRGALRVTNGGSASARLFLTVSGGTAVVVRDPSSGRVLFRGRLAHDVPVGSIAAGSARTVDVEARAAVGRLAFRFIGASL